MSNKNKKTPVNICSNHFLLVDIQYIIIKKGRGDRERIHSVHTSEFVSSTSLFLPSRRLSSCFALSVAAALDV